MTYQPLIDAPGDAPDVGALQSEIDAKSITHVKLTDGQIFKIFNRLNAKSVPLNRTDGGAARAPYSKVESFGIIAEAETTNVVELTRKEKLLSRENLERTLLQQAVVKDLKRIADDSKAEIHSVLADGEKQVVKNERGAELGSIYRTSPKPAARIVDLAVVAAQADDAGEELEYKLPAPGTPEYQQVVELTLVHNEDLLILDLTPEAVKNLSEKVLKEWKVTGQVPAGWEIVEGKSGYTVTRLNDTGKEVLHRLMQGTQNLLDDVTMKEIA